MEIGDITPPPYQVTQVLRSRGLASVARDGPAILLDYYGADATTAVRIAMPIQDGQALLANLRQLVESLARVVPPGTTSSLN